MISPKKSRRQEAKDRARVLKELYFLVQWDEKDQEDGNSLYDILPSKDIVCDDPLAIVEGQEMSALFRKKSYPVKIVGQGSYHDMENLIEILDSSSRMDTENATEIEDTVESQTPVDNRETSKMTDTEIPPPKEEATKSPGKKGSTKGPNKKGKSPSKPKSKSHKSTEKARAQESDRMTALILGEDDDTSSGSKSAKPSPKPKSKARKRERSSSKDEDNEYSPSQTSLRKSPLKSKAHKQESSPILPYASEDSDHIPSQSSSGKSPLKSKRRKRQSSSILSSTGEDDGYTSSRSSSGKSPPPLKRKRESSPILPSTGDDNDYTGLPLLDGSDGNESKQSKDGASVTPISHSISDPVQNNFGSGSGFLFPPHDTPRRWNENRLLSSQPPFLSDFSGLNYDSVSTNPSPNPSPVVTQTSMEVLSGASHSHFFPPVSPPFMMSHSQSWPPSNQNISMQMAEMKHLLLSSLSAMQSEIQTLKTNALNKPKKRKRSREQSSAGQSDSEQSEVSIRTPPPVIPGVLLGDPHGENKFISHPTVRQRDIRAVEAVCGDGKKFVLSALDIFFTKSTLARSLVTKKEGRDQLDPDIIEGLRLHTNYRYPATEDPIERWKKIQKSVNDKCRNTKNRSKE